MKCRWPGPLFEQVRHRLVAVSHALLLREYQACQAAYVGAPESIALRGWQIDPNVRGYKNKIRRNAGETLGFFTDKEIFVRPLEQLLD